ncbi:MAG: hypothetical protein ALECFALPRED_003046 [Alectoria fallacina]|uniref:Uncharacterized protein n=1 Tax=Alectoria fallacina TaxID=1903189 RepID=A0A8H3I4H8_9LECA|nr:MAG: hypothetical protein ALECFALPRED_003046 [Alectoria fallacina]
MNANEDGSWSERNPPLSGFYAYKNTFNDKTVWVDIPKQLTFYNTSNPYTDPGTPDLEAMISAQHELPYPQQQQDQWTIDHQLQDQSAQLHSHGLEALSAAALYAPPEANMIAQPMSMNRRHFDSPFEESSPNNEHGPPTIPSPNTVSSSNNLNFLLNPADAMDSPIDPSLMSTPTILIPPSSNGTAMENAQKLRTEGEAESEHKVAYLLRHFSESPGKWCIK